MDSKEVFTKIYDKNLWNDNESVSGSWSNDEQTKIVKVELPNLLNKFWIESLLDCPCGDYHWMKDVEYSGKYIGADVVEELIDENRIKYGDKFIVRDITKDLLPEVDAVLVRDCFVHLPVIDIVCALLNIYNSGIKYIIMTNFMEHDNNVDIKMWWWRALNFMEHPFMFPEPLYTLNEWCMEADWMFTDKSLCVWDMETVLWCITKNE